MIPYSYSIVGLSFPEKRKVTTVPHSSTGFRNGFENSPGEVMRGKDFIFFFLLSGFRKVRASKTNEDLACNAQGDERFLPHEESFSFFFFFSPSFCPFKRRYNSSNSYTQVAQSDPISPTRILVGAGFVFTVFLFSFFFSGGGPDV